MSGRALRWLLSLGVPGRDPRRGPARLTIVRHHRVYADGERPFYPLGVTASVLDAQVATCVRSGLKPMTVRDGLAHLSTGRGQAVAFTFDDGYADNVERAIPILRRHGAGATFYLTAGLMESRIAPWWDELGFVLEHTSVPRLPAGLGGIAASLELATFADRRAALAAWLPRLRVEPGEQRARLDALRAAARVDAPAPCALADWTLARGFVAGDLEVGAHTMTHPFLSLLGAEEQRREIADSAALLRARLGAEVTGLAYPVGDHDATTIEATRASGLAYAVTTESGDVRSLESPYTLVRRGLPEGACLGPSGRYSASMVRAELAGAFDRLRGRRAGAVA